MESELLIMWFGLSITWAAIGYLCYKQKNMVTSHRKGGVTLLKDADGNIAYTKIDDEK